MRRIVDVCNKHDRRHRGNCQTAASRQDFSCTSTYIIRRLVIRFPSGLPSFTKKASDFFGNRLLFVFQGLKILALTGVWIFCQQLGYQCIGLSLDCGKKKADASVVYKTIERRSTALPEHPRRQHKNPGGKVPLRVFAQKRGKKGVIEPQDWAASGQCPGTR